MIVDEQAVESLAGIMGGDATAVSDDDTTNIYVEAAFWWPDAMAGRARKLNFSTDAATGLSVVLIRHDRRSHREHHAADHGGLWRAGRAGR